MTTKTDEQERADFEVWEEMQAVYTPFDVWQAGRAALQSQGEVMEMALCESRRLVLRIGQAYRFVPMDGCKTCEEMKAEHDKAYGIDHARRIEGES